MAIKNRLLAFIILLLWGCGMKTLADSKQKALNIIYSNALTNYRLSLEIANKLLEQGDLSKDEYNIVLGGLAYRRGNYPATLSLYKRVSGSVEGFESKPDYKKVLNAMTESYLRIGDISNASLYARTLQNLSVKTADKYHEAAAIFWMGRISHANGRTKKAYQLMDKAIKMMRTVKSTDYDNIFYESLITRIEYMQRDGMNREEGMAIAEMEQMSAKAGSTAGCPQYSMTALMQKDLYAHKAVLAFREGNSEAAEKFYRKFQETGNDYQCDYQCILPYLKGTERYDDMISAAHKRIDYMHRTGTEHTMEMASIYNILGDGYYGKGDYKEAAKCYQQLSNIKNETINRVARGGIAELTSVYEMKNNDMESEQRDSRYQFVGIFMVTTITVSVLAATYIYISSFKSKVAGGNLESVNITDEMGEKHPLHDKEEEEGEQKYGQAETDRILFERMWKRLVDDKLYLQRDFNRDTLVNELKIPKNKFSVLFTSFTGQTYLQCITQLRLNHAVELLKSHPAYTIEAIAEECGMSNTSFYRLFAQHYGMTPTEYRETIKNDEA